MYGGVPGATDGTILTRDAGLATVVYGPGGKWIAHQADEFVEVADIVRCAKVYAEAARRFLTREHRMNGVASGTDQQPRPTCAGIRVGHATRRGDGWLTGTTVVLTGPGGAVGGVDVRGGGPGTRETDLLDPRNAVERVHAVVLTGGSAFGLAAADGVMQGLAADGVGFPVGGPGEVVPIVPGRGDLRPRPRRRLRAAGPTRPSAARRTAPPCRRPARTAVPRACVGAGTGASRRTAQGRHRLGQRGAAGRHHGRRRWSWSTPVGSTVDPDTGELYAARLRPRRRVPCAGSAVGGRRAAGRALGVAAAGPGAALAAGAGHDHRRASPPTPR